MTDTDVYEFGETIRFAITIMDENDVLCTPETVTISIKRPNNTLDELNTSMINDSTGVYHYDFTANVDDTLGIYKINITAISSLNRVTITRDSFTLVASL